MRDRMEAAALIVEFSDEERRQQVSCQINGIVQFEADLRISRWCR